jgi:hypothetical protein
MANNMGGIYRVPPNCLSLLQHFYGAVYVLRCGTFNLLLAGLRSSDQERLLAVGQKLKISDSDRMNREKFVVYVSACVVVKSIFSALIESYCRIYNCICVRYAAIYLSYINPLPKLFQPTTVCHQSRVSQG